MDAFSTHEILNGTLHTIIGITCSTLDKTQKSFNLAAPEKERLPVRRNPDNTPELH